MKKFSLLLLSLFLLSYSKQEIIGTPDKQYELSQNFPNPFADSTKVIYNVPYVGDGKPAPWIRLIVFDQFLQKQVTLVDDRTHPAKKDTVLWNGRGPNGNKVPAGFYYFELQQIDSPQSDNENNVTVLLRITALKK